MTPDIDYWQREAARHAESSARGAGRVHSILSFGLAAVTAIVAAGLYSRNAVVLSFAPIAGLFMLALILRASLEGLYFSGYQLLAERRMRDLIVDSGQPSFPVWRDGGGNEPPRLEEFNTATWIIGVGSFALMVAVIDGAAVKLNSDDWSDVYTVSGTVAMWLCVAAFVAGALLLSITGVRAVLAARSFVSDPTGASFPCSAPSSPVRRSPRTRKGRPTRR